MAAARRARDNGRPLLIGAVLKSVREAVYALLDARGYAITVAHKLALVKAVLVPRSDSFGAAFTGLRGARQPS